MEDITRELPPHDNRQQITDNMQMRAQAKAQANGPTIQDAQPVM